MIEWWEDLSKDQQIGFILNVVALLLIADLLVVKSCPFIRNYVYKKMNCIARLYGLGKYESGYTHLFFYVIIFTLVLISTIITF